MKLMKSVFSMLAALAIGLVSVPAHASLFVSTGQSNANVQLDIAHTQHWTFGVSADVNGVDGALFTMKEGPKTTDNISFVIFEGTYQNFLDNTYTALFSQSLTPSDFTQSYSPVMFQNSAINLMAGQTYTGVLYSNAPNTASEQYFIKGDTTYLAFVDGAGNIAQPGGSIVMGGSGGGSSNLVPEPGSVFLIASGVFLLAWRRRGQARLIGAALGYRG